MTRRMTVRLFASSIGIQAIGTLSTFALLVVVARLGGARVQGEFALLRAWIDFASIVAQFGLPQAYIFVVNKGMTSRGRLAAWSGTYSAATAGIACVATAVAILLGVLGAGSSLLVSAALLGASIGMLTFHRLVRSLLLTLTDGPAFALFTIFPTCILFAAVSAALLVSAPLEWAYLVAGLSGAVLAAWVAGRFGTTEADPAVPVRAMAARSWEMFLNSCLGAAQPLLIFWLCGLLGASTPSIGQLSVATISIVAAHAVFGMIAPILFNRWSKHLTPENSSTVFKPLMAATAVAVVVAITTLPFIPWLVGTIFGREFDAAARAMQIVILALPAILYGQVAAPAFFGLDRVSSVTWSSAIRLTVSVCCLVGLATTGLDPILAAAWAWLVGEWASTAWLFACASRSAISPNGRGGW